jgi:hypothetical protein
MISITVRYRQNFLLLAYFGVPFFTLQVRVNGRRELGFRTRDRQNHVFAFPGWGSEIVETLMGSAQRTDACLGVMGQLD